MPPLHIGPKRNGERIRRAPDSGKGPQQVRKTPVALSAKPQHRHKTAGKRMCSHVVDIYRKGK